MMKNSGFETALADWIASAKHRWPTQEDAVAQLEVIRWNHMAFCPYCTSLELRRHAEENRNVPRWQCRRCRKSFSVTVGTIFHHTQLPITTWILAITALLNARKLVRAAEVARALNLPYPTAWHLVQRIRSAMFYDPEQARLLRAIVATDNQRLYTPNNA